MRRSPPVAVLAFSLWVLLVGCEVPPRSLPPFEPLPHPDRLELLELLRNREYAELDRRLEEYQQRFERDPRYELDVELAYRTFWIVDPSIGPLLDEWIEQRPRSYAARFARARHLARLGSEARGGKWARDTPAENFRRMEELLIRAAADVQAALELHPGFSEAYAQLISLVTYGGDQSACDELADRALEIEPASFRVLDKYMVCHTPRWGGSYPAMEVVAGRAREQAARHPRLAALAGSPDVDRARYLLRDDRYDEAIELFSKALEAGPRAAAYSWRSDAYCAAGRYEACLADRERATELLPQNPELLVEKAHALVSLDRTSEALEILDLVSRLDPAEPDLERLGERLAQSLVVEGHRLAEAGETTASIARLDQAITASSTNSEAFYWRGRAYLKEGDLVRALADFEESIRIDPRRYESYLNVDWILAQRGAWGEIVRYWDQYLALEPTDSRAYFERAGTYRHAGKPDAARADLLRACKLGHDEACRYYERDRRRR